MSGFIKPCFIEAQSRSFICIELLSQDSNRVEKLWQDRVPHEA